MAHTMKCPLIILALSLLMTACSRQDAKLSKQIVGTWSSSSQHSMETYAPDGTFLTLVQMQNKTNVYAGTWQITNGIMVETYTNAPFHLTGQTFQFRIYSLNDHQLEYEAISPVFRFVR
jgi:hypothetical protein